MVVCARHRATMVSKEDYIENRLEVEKSGFWKSGLEIVEVALKEMKIKTQIKVMGIGLERRTRVKKMESF